MSNALDPQDDAGTELSAEEREGLIPSYISLRSELNDVEQTNIEEGIAWAERRKRKNILDEAFLKTLHQKMYGKVWTWAGTYRTTGKNIGVDAYRIRTDVHELLNNARYWIEHETFQPDEIAARFHHRLVQIHCYANGNGRHARVATDLLLQELGQQPFTWGSANLVDESDVRDRYIAAIKAADNHDIAALLEFARS
ncbi:MAG: mobile mystery protein B [Rhodothermales bacterium]|nr:mobile mystery protein B [Rhodothermales bacterium]